jgi:hypothetical protein
MKAMPLETCKSFREIFHKVAGVPFDPLASDCVDVERIPPVRHPKAWDI